MKRSTRRSNIKNEPSVDKTDSDTPKQIKLNDETPRANSKRNSRKKNSDDSAVVSGSLAQTVEETALSTPKQKSTRGRPSLRNKTEAKETEDANLSQINTSVTGETSDELDPQFKETSLANSKRNSRKKNSHDSAVVSGSLAQTVDQTTLSTLKRKSTRGRPSLRNKTETKETEDANLSQINTSLTGETSDELDPQFEETPPANSKQSSRKKNSDDSAAVSGSLAQTVEETTLSNPKRKSVRGKPLRNKTETKETEDANLSQINTSLTGETSDKLDPQFEDTSLANSKRSGRKKNSDNSAAVSGSLTQTVEETALSTPKQKSTKGRPSLRNKTETKKTEDANLSQINTSVTGETSDKLDPQFEDTSLTNSKRSGRKKNSDNSAAVSGSLAQTVEETALSTPKQKSTKGRPSSLRNKTETKKTEDANLSQINTSVTGETSDELDPLFGSHDKRSKTSRRELKRKAKEESDNSLDGSNSDDENADQPDEFRPQKRKSQRKKTIRRIVESDDSDDETVIEKPHETDYETVSGELPVPDEKIETENTRDVNEECQPVKRGRGRPRKSVAKDPDFDDTFLSIEDTPSATKKTYKRLKKAAVAVVDDENSEEEDSESGNAKVTCQVCNEEMTSKEFKRKHREVHYGLCWTQYDEPIDIYNPQTVMDILSLKRKKVIAETGRRLKIDLSFTCRFCNEVKKSELGYYSHMLVCNRSQEELDRSNRACAVCGKEIFLPHYRAHEMKHAKAEEWEEEEEELATAVEATPDLVEGGAKRSAARRAQSQISKITANLLDNQTGESKVKCDDDFEPSENEEEGESDETEESEEDEKEEADDVEQTGEDSFSMEYSDMSDILESDNMADGTIPVQGTAVRQPFAKKFTCIEDLTFAHKSLMAMSSSEPLPDLFVPPQIEYLDGSTAQEYLPQARTSMLMTHAHRKDFRLDLFAADTDANQSVLFCGGPVFAMAWCPHPLSLSPTNEYLAIASQPDINRTHKKNVSQSYKSVIQIWKFPQLTCLKPMKSLHSPEMVLGVAHEEGAVWHLEWCPSGGYIPNRTLGILAAACSSGRILLYAVPWLDSLDVTKRISLLKPVLTLQIDELNRSPCYRIAWQHLPTVNSIYAGYGDGCVAIFDMNATETLKLDHNILLPVHVFQAHFSEILVLSLCSCEDTFLLVTSSNDRMTKLWDVTDFTSPLHIVHQKVAQKRPLCGGFFPNLHLHIIGSDHNNFEEAAYLVVTAVRDFTLAKDGLPRITQTVAHFTLSFSKYCCSLLIGNEDGQVTLIDYRRTVFTRKKEKPVVVIHANLTPINENDAEKNGQRVETARVHRNQVTVSTYEDVCRRYKMDFTAKSKTNEGPAPHEDCDVVNFTSSCWNNNANNFQFIAMGQKCGVVHVTQAKSHSQYQLDFFSKFLEKQKGS